VFLAIAMISIPNPVLREEKAPKKGPTNGVNIISVRKKLCPKI
jgi:hypothetical protein